MKRIILSFFLAASMLQASVANEVANNYHVEASLPDAPLLAAAVGSSQTTYHLFSHGRPGELLIGGQWLNATQIVEFLTPSFTIGHSPFKNLHIYGCHFAQGNKGLAAVVTLEQELGIKVAASTNTTGKDGDWLLEVGNTQAHEFKNYAHSLQDTDGDGVLDSSDIDDDNDGILDTTENISFMDISSATISGTSPNFTISNIIIGGIKASIQISDQNSASFIFDPEFLSGAEFDYDSSSFDIQFTGFSSIKFASSLGNNLSNSLVFTLTFDQPVRSTVINIGQIDFHRIEFTGTHSEVLLSSGSEANFSSRVFSDTDPSTVNNKDRDGFASIRMFSATPITTFEWRYIDNPASTQSDDGNHFALYFDESDKDLDNVVNSLDLDSDNDGIPDNIEAFPTASYVVPDYIEGNNGLHNNYENNDTASATSIATIPDTDSDGTPDYLDTDSDGDGIDDVAENFDPTRNFTNNVGNNGLDTAFETNNFSDDYSDVNGDAHNNTDFSLAKSNTTLPNTGSGAVPLNNDFDYRDYFDGDIDNDGFKDESFDPNANGQPCDSGNEYDNACDPVCNFTASTPFEVEITQKYAMTGSQTIIYQTPIIGDVDGDGDVEYVMISTDNLNPGGFPSTDTKRSRVSQNLLIINASDGAIERKIATPLLQWSGTFTPTIADVDGDGTAEIFVLTSDQNSFAPSIQRYEHNSNSVTPSPTNSVPLQTAGNSSHSLGIADFNMDGRAELYVYDEIYDAQTLELLLVAGGTNFFDQITSIAADVRSTSPGLELISGGSVYEINITNTSGTSGNSVTKFVLDTANAHPSIADMDLDGELDVVLRKANNVAVWNPRSLSRLAESFFAGDPSSVAIANIDDDCNPEILVVSNNRLQTFTYNGTATLQSKWNLVTVDASSNTGVATFDFNSDGKNEVVYRDEQFFRVVNGSGTLIGTFGCTSSTGWERPAIADIDNDGAAEIITGCGTRPGNINVFESSSHPWAPARNVWNQYAYTPTAINDDLTVVQYQQNHAQLFTGGNCGRTSGCNQARPLNGFMQQQSSINGDGCPVFDAASITIEVSDASQTSTLQTRYNLVVTVCNLSSDYAVANVPFTIYDKDPTIDASAVRLTTIPAQPQTSATTLINGACDTVNIQVESLGGIPNEIFIVANDDNSQNPIISFPVTYIPECDYTDNVQRYNLCDFGIDTDGDGIADSCDLDDDNDGILDIDENSVVTDVLLWLDASRQSSVVLDGSNNVVQWTDLSGNGNHATSTSAERVAYNTSENYLHNPPGRSSFMSIPNDIFAGQSQGGIIYVGRQEVDFDAGWGVYGGNTPMSVQETQTPSLPSAGNRHFDSFLATSRVSSNAVNGIGTRLSIQGRFNTGSVLNFYDNATQVGSVAAGFTNVVQDYELFGNSGIYRIYELIMYTDDSQRQELEGHLAWKWGIQAELPSTHPYATTPPNSFDLDGDNLINSLDLDSDNDGIPDNIEAFPTASYVVPDYIEGNNGLHNNYENNDTASATSIATIPDTDSDGTPDYLDTDSDGDGIDDVAENFDPTRNFTNNVGNNGLDTAFETNNFSDDYSDVNGDAHNNTDFLLADTDGDTAGNTTNAAPRGTDFDYRDNRADVDTDGDQIFDFEDIDDDNDGILDVDEGYRVTEFFTDPNSTDGSGGILGNSITRGLGGNYRASYITPDISSFLPGISDYQLNLSISNYAERFIIGFNESGDNTDVSWETIDYGLYISVGTASTATIRVYENGSESYRSAYQGGDRYSVVKDGNDFALLVNGIEVHRSIGAASAPSYYIDSSFANSSEFTIQNITLTGPSIVIDSDGDGVIDRLDLDSDNDGITDNVEAQATANYIPPSGIINTTTRIGLSEAYVNTNSYGLIPIDTDKDGEADIVDANSDNDNLNDVAESYASGVVTNIGPIGNNGLGTNVGGGNSYFSANIRGNAHNGSQFSLINSDLTRVHNTTTGSGAISLIDDFDYRDRDVDVDTDGDNYLDYEDLDDDNDGIVDLDELACSLVTIVDSVTPGGGLSTTNPSTTTTPNNDTYANLMPNAFPQGVLFPPGINFTSNLTNTQITYRFDGFYNEVYIAFVNFDGMSYTFTDQSGNPLEFVLMDAAPQTRIVGNAIYDANPSGGAGPGESGTGIAKILNTNLSQVNVALKRTCQNCRTTDNFIITFAAVAGADGSIPSTECQYDGINNRHFTDTDGDQLPSRLDPDSDNDGCPDMFDGNGDFTFPSTPLENPLPTLSDPNNPINVNQTVFTLSSTRVDNQGVPLSVVENIASQSQAVGTSQDANLTDDDCPCTDTTNRAPNCDLDGDGIINSIDIDDDNDGILDVDENTALFALTGSASFLGQNEFQLTPNVRSVSGTAMFDTTVDFSNDFNFGVQVNLGLSKNSATGTSDISGDGISLYFHNDPPGGINSRIPFDNGIELRIDTYSGNGIIDDNIRLLDSDDRNELSPRYLFNVDIEDNQYHDVFFLWNAATSSLKVTFDGLLVAEYTDSNIANLFAGVSKAYFSSFASTGAAFNQHRIRFLDLPSIDTDNDGVYNIYDLDSDNDGIPDNVEAQTTENYIVPGLLESSMLDANLDGLNDVYDSAQPNTGSNISGNYTHAGTGLSVADTDSDGIPDFLDLDSDADGINDVSENFGAGEPFNDNVGLNGLDSGFEANNNDNFSDVNGKAYNDLLSLFLLADNDGDTSDDGSNAESFLVDFDYRDVRIDQDTDGDNFIDSIDLDDDNDGILDINENIVDATLNGSATYDSAQNLYILTPDRTNVSGTIIFDTKVNFSRNFSFSFDLNLGLSDNNATGVSDTSGDGIGVFFHNDPRGLNAVGGAGGGLGTYDIQNAIALIFDTYQNFNVGGDDPPQDHLSLVDPDAPFDSTGQTDLAERYIFDFDIEDNQWRNTTILWDSASATLKVFLDYLLVIEYTDPNIVSTYFGGNPEVYFGAGAATGLASNLQRIRFLNLPSIDSDFDGIPNISDPDSDGDQCPDMFEGSGDYANQSSDGSLDDQTSPTDATVTQKGVFTTGDETRVDDRGVPYLDRATDTTSGATPADQAVGDSQDFNVQATDCPCTDTTNRASNCDYDGDGVKNGVDLDDDNDGILDSRELGETVIIPSSESWSPTSISVIAGETYAFQIIGSTRGTFTAIGGPNDGNTFYEVMFESSTQSITDYVGNIYSSSGVYNSSRSTGEVPRADTSLGITTPRRLYRPFAFIDTNGDGNYNEGSDELIENPFSTDNLSGFNQYTPLSSGQLYFAYADRDGASLNNLGDLTISVSPISNGSITSVFDTDSDGLINSLDPDSDDDGCPDMYDGAGDFTGYTADSSMVLPDGPSTNNSAAEPKTVFTINDNTAVDADGVPTVVRVIIGSQSQDVGDSQDFNVQGVECPCDDPTNRADNCDLDGDQVPNGLDIDDDNDGIIDVVESLTFDFPLTLLRQDNAPLGQINVSLSPVTNRRVSGFNFGNVDFDVIINSNTSTIGSSSTTNNTATVDNATYLRKDRGNSSFSIDFVAPGTNDPVYLLGFVFQYGDLDGVSGADESIPNFQIRTPNSIVNYGGGFGWNGWLDVNNLPPDVTDSNLSVNSSDVLKSLYPSDGNDQTQKIAYLDVASIPISGFTAGFQIPGDSATLFGWRFRSMTALDATSIDEDFDRDGIPNRLDLDSDDDGIPDNVEAQTTQDYIVPSYNISLNPNTGITDSTQDGLDDNYDTGNIAGNVSSGFGLLPFDTDLDQQPDFKDQDSDNDTIFDVDENYFPTRPLIGVGDNGLSDNAESSDDYTDVNGDAHNGAFGGFNLKDEDNEVDFSSGGNILSLIVDFDYRDTDVTEDTDGDNVLDPFDLDDDNDGILDTFENPSIPQQLGPFSTTNVTETVQVPLANFPIGTSVLISDLFVRGDFASGGENYSFQVNSGVTQTNLGGSGVPDCSDVNGDFSRDNGFDVVSSTIIDLGSGRNGIEITIQVSDGVGPANDVSRTSCDGQPSTYIDFIFTIQSTDTSGDDTDNDGLINSLDPDSDDDGCPDMFDGAGAYEAEASLGQLPNGASSLSNPSGLVDVFTFGDSNAVDADGIPFLNNGSTTTVTTTLATQAVGTSQDANLTDGDCPCTDTTNRADNCDYDGDGVKNGVDLDDDNDGILDVEEFSIDVPFVLPSTFGQSTINGSIGSDVDVTVSATNPSLIRLSSEPSVNPELNSVREYTNLQIIDNNSGIIEFDFSKPVYNPVLFVVSLVRNSQINASYGNIAFELANGETLSNLDLITTQVPSGGFDVNPSTITSNSAPLQKFVVGSASTVVYSSSSTTNQGSGYLILSDADARTVLEAGGVTKISVLKSVSGSGGAESYSRILISARTPLDFDNDGTYNHHDPDSDGDGCPDALEGDATFQDSDLNGSIEKTYPTNP